MITKHTIIRTLLAVMLITAVAPGTVAAQEAGEGETIIDISLDPVTDAINNLLNEVTSFTNNWDDTLTEVLKDLLFQPFRVILQQLLNAVTTVLTTTPNVHPNPAVEEIHGETLLVTYVTAGLGFVIAGILYIVGPVLGISYAQVRMILPRLFVALAFAAVSLPLLQLGVDLANAFVTAFKPSGISASIGEFTGLQASIVVVWVINAFLLLALVALFIIRDVYILFVAAISPLIALAWAFPRTKRYADTFIAGWFTALAMAPLDLLVLRFLLALMDGSGGTALQSVSNWVLGVAGFVLLLFVPYQLYGASQAIVGQAFMIAHGAKGTLRRHRRTQGSDGIGDRDATMERRRSAREHRADRWERGRGGEYR